MLPVWLQQRACSPARAVNDNGAIDENGQILWRGNEQTHPLPRGLGSSGSSNLQDSSGMSSDGEMQEADYMPVLFEEAVDINWAGEKQQLYQERIKVMIVDCYVQMTPWQQAVYMSKQAVRAWTLRALSQVMTGLPAQQAGT